jgi:LAO/AO transport system kinase
MDHHQFDEVVLETVGVGQLECAVRDLVDVTVLVLNPASGDHIQAMKAGVLEAADIIVVNKADLAGADQAVAEVQSVIHVRQYPERAWIPPVIKVWPRDDTGVIELDETLARHLGWRDSVLDPLERRRARRAYHLATLLSRRSAEAIRGMSPEYLDAELGESFDKLLQSLR